MHEGFRVYPYGEYNIMVSYTYSVGRFYYFGTDGNNCLQTVSSEILLHEHLLFDLVSIYIASVYHVPTNLKKNWYLFTIASNRKLKTDTQIHT